MLSCSRRSVVAATLLGAGLAPLSSFASEISIFDAITVEQTRR